jgi:hypothetical protein
MCQSSILSEATDLCQWPYYRRIHGTVKYLSNFSCLAYLEIPAVLLLGRTPSITQLATILQSSLRNLTLTTTLDYVVPYKRTREELDSYVGDCIKTVASTASLRKPKNLQRISRCLCSNGELGTEQRAFPV